MGDLLIARGDQLGMPVAARVYAAGSTSLARHYLGQYDEGGYGSVPPQTTVGLVGRLALSAAASGKRDDAQKLLEVFRERVIRDADTWNIQPATLLLFLEAAVVVKDKELAAEITGYFAERAGGLGVQFSPPSKGRVLGAAAALLGETGKARLLHQQGLEAARSFGHRPEIALTRLGLAELDVAEGHVEAAQEHLAFCIPELEAMRMRPGLERALALREQLGEDRPRGLAAG